MTIDDDLGRSFETLRLSLTDQCNLACTYCTDSLENNRIAELKEKGLVKKYSLYVQRIHQINPLKVVRITGGEPLLFKGIAELVRSLKSLGIPKVKITTNAVFLRTYAIALKEAGIDSINISLDALDEQTFKTVTRKNNLSKVLEGIDAAVAINIPIKINSVILKDINDHAVLPLFEFAKERDISIRYLELMRMGYLHHEYEQFFFSQAEILNTIAEKYNFIATERNNSSTANYWRTDDFFKFGVIANETQPFCHDCNRLRLDNNGKIYGCLSNPNGFNFDHHNASDDDLKTILFKSMQQKQRVSFKGSEISMKFIGG